MEENKRSLNYRFVSFQVEEYEVKPEPVPSLENASFNLHINFGVHNTKTEVGVQIKCIIFSSGVEWIKTTVVGGIEIVQDSWSKILIDNTITLPLEAASHFVSLVVGTLRGVLCERLNNMGLPNFLLPFVAIDQYIHQDIKLIINPQT